MQLPDAAQESLQNVLVANHRAELPVLAAGPLKSHHARALARGELAGAGRQKFSQPGKGLDAGNVFAEGQQPYLVVASRHSPSRSSRMAELNASSCAASYMSAPMMTGTLKPRRIIPSEFGGEVGAEIARHGNRIAAFAPHQELRAGLLQTAGLRSAGRSTDAGPRRGRTHRSSCRQSSAGPVRPSGAAPARRCRRLDACARRRR